MFAISTTSSDTRIVMMVMTTRISTSVKPFLRLIAPPNLRLIPVRPERCLLVFHAVGRRRRRRVPAEVAARAPDVEAADVNIGRSTGARGARRGTIAARLSRDVVAIVDPVGGGFALRAEHRIDNVPVVEHFRAELEVRELLGALLREVGRQVLAAAALARRIDGEVELVGFAGLGELADQRRRGSLTGAAQGLH